MFHLRVLHSQGEKAPRVRTFLGSAKVARRAPPLISEETMPQTILSLKSPNVFLELSTNSKLKLVSRTLKVLLMPAQQDLRSKLKVLLARIRGERLKIATPKSKREMVICKHLTI